MITSAISSAARLPFAPARLAGRMAGALLRGLRGSDSGGTSSARSSARSTSATRSRAKSQTKRTATRSAAKASPERTKTRARPKSQPSTAQSKRTKTRARPKSQPSTAQSKRTKTRARPKSQPSTAQSKRTKTRARPKSQPSTAQSKRTAGPAPLGDVAIAREVESSIFRDLDADRGQVDVKVADGVVRLRGEVPTPDLISELETRAARVPQVRRVENLLRTPAPTPKPATPAARQVDPWSKADETSGSPAPTDALRTRNFAAATRETGAAAPAEGAGGTAEPPAGRPEGEESVDDRDAAAVAEVDKGPRLRPSGQ
jgi:osmotically-inducible protein OsmY